MALSFRQELVAVFGHPVAENPTQAMVEAAFRHHGLDWRYLTIDVAPVGLPAAVAGARAMGFRGFHCTIPHKVAVLGLLDRVGDAAELIGAVNTVVSRDGELVGENTDGRGFLDALRRRLEPRGLRVVILGAGGAARAIAVELLLAGAADLTVVNRSEERGRELVAHLERVAATQGQELPSRYLAWPGELALPAADVVVNATSIGLFPGTGTPAIDPASLGAETLVADVVPNPPRTRFLAEAESRGCQTVDGLEMLVEQGALSVELWTGVEPERAVMRETLAAVFAG